MSENVQDQKAAPSKEEVLLFLNEQIEVKEVQLRLQSLNADLAEARAREVKALAFVAQLTTPQPTQQDNIPEGAIPHTLTQQDLDDNPDLAEQGFKVGDDVLVNAEPVEEKSLKPRGLKKTK
jgi:hypothetical protein